jgi:hypothetical protein
VGLVACPSGFDPIAWSKRMSRRNPNNSDCRISVVHHLLTTEETEWLIPIDDFDGSGFDVVVCGDLHQGFPPVRSQDCLFLNPGSLARTQKTSNDMVREIRGVDILIDSDGSAEYEFWPVECAGTGEEVFKPNAPVIEEEVCVSEDKTDSEEVAEFEEVIDALGSIGVSKIDVWDMLERKAREEGLDEAVLNYILSKRPAA